VARRPSSWSSFRDVYGWLSRLLIRLHEPENMTIRILDVHKPANTLNGHLWKNDRDAKSDALTQRLLPRRNHHLTYEGIDWLHLRHWGRAGPRQEPAIDSWCIRRASLYEPVLGWPLPLREALAEQATVEVNEGLGLTGLNLKVDNTGHNFLLV
jgi:hypothetical protein